MVDKNTDLSIIKRILIGMLCGACTGFLVFWYHSIEGLKAYVVTGALIGIILSLLWKTIYSIAIQFSSQEWQVTEFELSPSGPKWNFRSSGAQRKVAWALFVETTTRISTQQIEDSAGDDGVTLKSLYDLFRVTRQLIAEMSPVSILPSEHNKIDTIETYALAMLNQDLRPFLSKWHPIWESAQPKNGSEPVTPWARHIEFREELRVLQESIKVHSRGFAKIAGVPETDRLLNKI